MSSSVTVGSSAMNCTFLRRFSHFKVITGFPNSCFNVLCKNKLQSPTRGVLVLPSLNFDCGRRHFGTEVVDKKSGSINNLTPQDSLVLYRFKWIKQLRFISRVKIAHVAVVISLTWPMSLWYSSGLISFPTLVCAIAGAAGTTAGLVALSFFFRRVVGELSFDENAQEVTISSLSFWGNRCNRTFPLTSLVPLSDSGIDMKNTFHRLEVHNSKDVYLLNLRYCKIFDEMFFSVTGLPVEQTDSKTTVVASKK